MGFFKDVFREIWRPRPETDVQRMERETDELIADAQERMRKMGIDIDELLSDCAETDEVFESVMNGHDVVPEAPLFTVIKGGKE